MSYDFYKYNRKDDRYTNVSWTNIEEPHPDEDTVTVACSVDISGSATLLNLAIKNNVCVHVEKIVGPIYNDAYIFELLAKHYRYITYTTTDRLTVEHLEILGYTQLVEDGRVGFAGRVSVKELTSMCIPRLPSGHSVVEPLTNAMKVKEFTLCGETASIAYTGKHINAIKSTSLLLANEMLTDANLPFLKTIYQYNYKVLSEDMQKLLLTFDIEVLEDIS